jgi:hypothetical protein
MAWKTLGDTFHPTLPCPPFPRRLLLSCAGEAAERVLREHQAKWLREEGGSPSLISCAHQLRHAAISEGVAHQGGGLLASPGRRGGWLCCPAQRSWHDGLMA